MNFYLESIARGIGPETKKVVISKDIFLDIIKDDILHRDPTSIVTVFGVELEVDPKETTIRFE